MDNQAARRDVEFKTDAAITEWLGKVLGTVMAQTTGDSKFAKQVAKSIRLPYADDEGDTSIEPEDADEDNPFSFIETGNTRASNDPAALQQLKAGL